MLSKIKQIRQDFKHSMEASKRINQMPAITPEQIAAKHEAVVAARNRRFGQSVESSLLSYGDLLLITAEASHEFNSRKWHIWNHGKTIGDYSYWYKGWQQGDILVVKSKSPSLYNSVTVQAGCIGTHVTFDLALSMKRAYEASNQ
jgi:hypothetical protein